MRGIYKYLIYATIPLALMISSGAAAIGATLQGLIMWFMLAVSIGGGVYIVVVLELLIKINRLQEQIRRERRIVNYYAKG